ncbi:GAF domain-containing protein [Deinococcus ruber]|uniref:histidine kinase n=1 Tax=Deinococcus ruber TaxID=1848197 RepID=A0A918FBK4_9DEIO|nr:GAF domain-containing protein [Deinococcus ruber]GGR19355.1 hypothetical protein GCM10008957_34830 [Deinococcus ruber]
MSEPPDVGSSALPPLSGSLQRVTEALAATTDQEAVFRTVLESAVSALNAVAGAVLLADETGRSLVVAATRGYEAQAQHLWHGGPLDSRTRGAVLERQQPMFFEHQDALIATFPELNARIGGVPVASALLPMFLDERPLGTLLLDFKEPHTFTLEEKRFLHILAAQCALAVGRAQLLRTFEARIDQVTRAYEAARQNAELLAALGDVLQRATRPDEIATFALSQLGPTLKALSMLVVYLDGQKMLPPILWGDTPATIADHMLQPGLSLQETPLLRRVLQEGRGLYLDNYWLDPDAVSSFPALAVGAEPIWLPGGRIGGFLVIWRPLSTGGWQSTEQEILRRASTTLGLALNRARQSETLKEQHSELAVRAQALEAFAVLSRDFTLEHDPLRLVGRAQELILSLLPQGVSTYYELHSELWHLRSHRGEFRDPALLEKLQGGLDRGSILNIERPYETRQPYYQNLFDSATTKVAREEFTAIQATAALPILVGNAVYGVLVFGFYQARAWSSSECAVLETAARSLGIALERSRTNVQLLQQRDALDLRSQELQAVNDELEAFTYSASHDLRTPVRHVMGFAELTQKALATARYDKADEYLEIIRQAAGRMTSLIDGMLVLSRSGRQELQLRSVDLTALVMQARRDVALEFAARPVTWNIGTLPHVYGDPAMLQQVLTNLLSNAVKYSAKREQSVVTIWADEHPAEWAIHVQDNGVGFDPAYATKLFGIFQRLHHERDFQGTGVGLATVRRIVLKHGGRVFAESQGDGGATFSFTLPRQPEAEL